MSATEISQARLSVLDLAVIAVLAAVSTLAFGPVFGGLPGYLAAGGGALLGLAIAALSAWRRWGIAATTIVLILVYIVFVGVFALRDTTIAGFIPSLETLGRGALLVVQSWRDLLTVSIPASSFSGPAVAPFITGLVCSTLGGRLALSRRYWLAAIIPMAAFLVVGILWGMSRAPYALIIGLVFVVVSLGWASYRQARGRASVQDELGIPASQTKPWQRVVAAAGVLLLAAGAAGYAAPRLADAEERFVLRRIVVPPLDLRNYASPLMSYRYFEVDQKDIELFHVTGLPEGARLRLATLDSYDGIVYNVADGSAGFARAGAEIEPRLITEVPVNAPGEQVSLDVGIDEYAGVWLPGGGDLRGVNFSGENAAEQAKTLYYNSNTGTALVTAGLAAADSYQVNVVLPPEVSDEELIDLGIRQVPLPTNSRVPDAVVKKSSEIVADASGEVEQVLAIEKALQQGFYSAGTDGNSLSGHSNKRIHDLLSNPQMIGDDEQYAVAMALMLRQLQIPARVVMGFYPEAEAPVAETWQVTGTQAHVWVEVPFNEVGWVAFDPTPDRDRVPETTVPKPNPKPRPQVQPPPIPPQEPLDVPDRLGDDKTDSDEDPFNWAIFLAVGKVVGIAALVASPFVGLALLRRRRRHQRMTAELPADRLTGGWAELVDNATDLGIKLDPMTTRREQARALFKASDDLAVTRLAQAVDHGVFGAGTPRDEFIAEVWTGTGAAVKALQRSASRWRRLGYYANITSLRKPALTGPVVDHKRSLISRFTRGKS